MTIIIDMVWLTNVITWITGIALWLVLGWSAVRCLNIIYFPNEYMNRNAGMMLAIFGPAVWIAVIIVSFIE